MDEGSNPERIIPQFPVDKLNRAMESSLRKIDDFGRITLKRAREKRLRNHARGWASRDLSIAGLDPYKPYGKSHDSFIDRTTHLLDAKSKISSLTPKSRSKEVRSATSILIDELLIESKRHQQKDPDRSKIIALAARQVLLKGKDIAQSTEDSIYDESYINNLAAKITSLETEDSEIANLLETFVENPPLKQTE